MTQPVDTAIPPGSAPATWEAVGRVVRLGEAQAYRAISDVAACLMPLLSAIGWKSNPRRLAEALPHCTETLNLDDLRDVLANLNYATRPKEVLLDEVDERLVPCLFVRQNGPAMVLLERDGDIFTVFDGDTTAIAKIDGRGVKGTAYFVSATEQAPDQVASPAQAGQWFETTARRFYGLVWQMLGVTLLTSLLSLVPPLFILVIYDKVVASRSVEMLAYLGLGALLALAFDLGLRTVRARLLAYLGARIDVILGLAAFEQILHLPIIMTERASIGAQLARLRQFEAVREFFTGPLAGVFLELPFVFLFVAAIAVIGGPLAWIPVILIAAFALMGAILTPILRRRIAESSEARSQRQSFIVEMLSHMRVIRATAAEDVWSERHRDLSARAASSGFRATQVSVFVQTIAQLFMLCAGIATLAVGSLRAMDGAMSIGALIASMALVWRVLSPLQLAFISLTRLEQVLQGLRQVNQLMKLKPEREPGHVPMQQRAFKGEIKFHRVSLRYTPNAEPALLGINLTIEPGELVVVTGTNGSGKSSILKLVAGLYQPQAGAVLIDGIDIRQLDIAELRGAIAFVPQTTHLFHGTIAQNMRLAEPMASEADLAAAAVDAHLVDEILTLPEGFDTRITDQLQRQLPKGFKQRLLLARAYTKKTPIYLLDEPGANLDADGDAALRRKLLQLRGNATVLAVTHRPSHMRLADRVIVLEAGQLLMTGTPDEVLPKIGLG